MGADGEHMLNTPTPNTQHPTMSTETRPAAPTTLAWYERAGDWANPILVKETRQALKSKQFVATFLLLLAAAWVVSLFILMTWGSAIEFGAIGRDVFYFFYFVLAVATILVVPFTAFRSLLSERDYNTFELLSVTTLSPRQIVWGKLAGALVQLLIFYSAITPFIAFTSLLQGFDAPSAACILVGSLLASLLLSMAALMLSTFAVNRVAQGVMTIAVLSALAFALWMALLGVGGMIQFDVIDVTSPDFWWAALFIVLVGVSYFLVFQQITTAQLTFESGNRSTGVRVVISAQFWIMWIAFLAFMQIEQPGYDDELPLILATISCVNWAAAGLFAATEDNSLSRRVRRDMTTRPFLRLLSGPWMPGGSRGLIYALSHVAVTWLLVILTVAIFGRAGSSDSAMRYLGRVFLLEDAAWIKEVRIVTAMCCYVIVFLCFGAALGRWGRAASTDVRPSHVRVLTFLAFMACIITPFLPRVLGNRSWSYTLLDVTNPFTTLAGMASGQVSARIASDALSLVILAALFGIAVNLPAMYRGVRDVVTSTVRPRTVERG